VGGFLLIRFADVMLSAPFILAILAHLAAYRLLWDPVVMLTHQPKTAGWSIARRWGL
jgi:NAD(P)H-quinone oxidoreductase subunit 5